ncbi:hypothetical protein Pint_27840 [Pistacia integerrima]|uniref:Uncharacterized protein n=1 Tax=Pistacia integerrima TaxID=434235 RepID=A0ACC0YUI3_9ROSI|nr:hypothetical protein Pint_27840 [Pistacia integerrima]
MLFTITTTLYKKPISPTKSLINLSTPQKKPNATSSTHNTSTCISSRDLDRLTVNPQQPSIFLASTSWSHCFGILKKKKEMVAVDQYIIATFFASLAGFLLLFLLRRNDKKTTKKDAGTYKIGNDIVHSAVGNGDYSSPDGTDVIIVGAGVAGAALAHTLGKDGKRVHVIERDLTEPDRIVGELLQPGGYLKLIELGLEDCVEEIDAQRVLGYALFKDGKSAKLSYPLEKFHADVAGRSFHNGRFIQRMREKAATLPKYLPLSLWLD